MQIKVMLAHRPAAPLLLQGLLVDSAMFQDDGAEYLVLALYRDGGDGGGTVLNPLWLWWQRVEWG